MNRVTWNQVDKYVEDLNALGQELGLKGAGHWVVMNRYGSAGADKDFLEVDPSNGGHTHNTALGEHSWRTAREARAGLRGLLAGLRATRS